MFAPVLSQISYIAVFYFSRGEGKRVFQMFVSYLSAGCHHGRHLHCVACPTCMYHSTVRHRSIVSITHFLLALRENAGYKPVNRRNRYTNNIEHQHHERACKTENKTITSTSPEIGHTTNRMCRKHIVLRLGHFLCGRFMFGAEIEHRF